MRNVRKFKENLLLYVEANPYISTGAIATDFSVGWITVETYIRQLEEEGKVQSVPRGRKLLWRVI